jgi:cytochrome-b5 reductase
MATLFARTSKSLPLIAGATLAGSAAVAYTYSKTTPSGHQLDSAQNAPSKLLTFPKSMLFPQTLTVTNTEQINHDTKRITFSLPGGEDQISGVPAGCK